MWTLSSLNGILKLGVPTYAEDDAKEHQAVQTIGRNQTSARKPQRRTTLKQTIQNEKHNNL